jgi:Ca2+-binding EF-hand superfamily protein
MFEQEIGAAIDQIWSNYDTNNSGFLGMDEASNFIKDFVGQVEINEGQLFKAFNQLDTNQSGTIE